MLHRISISSIFIVLIISCLTTSIYFILINNKDHHYLSFKQQSTSNYNNNNILPKKRSKYDDSTSTATTATPKYQRDDELDIKKLIKTEDWHNINKINNNVDNNKPFRILHIITSSTLTNSDGDNRLKTKLLPTLLHTIDSIQYERENGNSNWQIDIYLILGYKLDVANELYIKELLKSKRVGLEIWDDATPHAKNSRGIVSESNTFLARQHRFVLKDKLDHYDFFSCWEDDMRVTAEHIKLFLYLSNELDQLREKAKKIELLNKNNTKIRNSNNHGNFKSALTVDQIDRLLPGFIRVEVLKTPIRQTSSKNKDNNLKIDSDPIPFDTYPCCSPPTIVQNNSYNASLLKQNHPNYNDIVLWETAIQGISLRFIPNSDYAFKNVKWIGLLPSGNPKQKNPKSNIKSISTYPKGGDENPRLFAQQGGWMLTKEQILLFDTKTCPGGFLPPYNNTKHWRDNGLQNPGNAVEFWSGGFHLFLNCHVKRIVSVEPDLFARQLMFHTSLNKQFQRRDRLVPASKLLSQIRSMVPKSSSLDDVEIKI